MIYASNELDENVIASLKQQGAKIGAWGVGTRLVTGADDAALGGVYKLTAIRDKGGPWKRKIKLSEQSAKISVPGILQTRRFVAGAEFAGDLIYDVEDGEPSRTLIDMLDVTRRKTVPEANLRTWRIPGTEIFALCSESLMRGSQRPPFSLTAVSL